MAGLDPDFGRFGIDYRSILRSGFQNHLSGETVHAHKHPLNLGAIFLRRWLSLFGLVVLTHTGKLAHFVTDYSVRAEGSFLCRYSDGGVASAVEVGSSKTNSAPPSG